VKWTLRRSQSGLTAGGLTGFHKPFRNWRRTPCLLTESLPTAHPLCGEAKWTLRSSQFALTEGGLMTVQSAKAGAAQNKNAIEKKRGNPVFEVHPSPLLPEGRSLLRIDPGRRFPPPASKVGLDVTERVKHLVPMETPFPFIVSVHLN